ncbi:MAG: dihydrolipoyl dehydrogenase [Clostridia bacterium]|nr:dihydrolipoyl dehydrogenase [Clostridia bacterium]
MSIEKKDTSVHKAPYHKDYEVGVIGGGPGGYVAAIKAAQSGKKTCIIEKESIGGVCLNRGCIPTKTLLRSVESLRQVIKSSEFGVIDIDSSNAKMDMKIAQARKNKIVGRLVGGVKGLLEANGVTILKGEAAFIDKNTVGLGDRQVTAENIIIASGSVPKKLPIKVSDDAQILTSKEVLQLDEVPKSIAIIGGGVIGVEFAYLLASLGTKVTIVESSDRILPMVDEEITVQVTSALKSMDIDIHTSSKVTEISGKKVMFEKDGQYRRMEAEKILVSVGRAPSTKGLNIERIGIATERGAIITDERLRTNIAGIFAIGDVNGRAMLAHTASMEGIIAVENICGKDIEMDYDKIPNGIYIQPEIAFVGLTEKQAKERYGEVKVGKFPLAANGKARVEGEERGFIKVIIEPRLNEIVGVHIYSIHATDMISEAVVAIKLEGTAEEVAMSVHLHPTVSEIMHEAFHDAVSKAIHFVG